VGNRAEKNNYLELTLTVICGKIYCVQLKFSECSTGKMPVEVHGRDIRVPEDWIPVFTGMTKEGGDVERGTGMTRLLFRQSPKTENFNRSMYKYTETLVFFPFSGRKMNTRRRDSAPDSVADD